MKYTPESRRLDAVQRQLNEHAARIATLEAQLGAALQRLQALEARPAQLVLVSMPSTGPSVPEPYRPLGPYPHIGPQLPYIVQPYTQPPYPLPPITYEAQAGTALTYN